MQQIVIYALTSVIVVSLISLIGIITIPIKESKLRSLLIYFISFSVGALLGDVFIHLLPEVVEEYGGFPHEVSFYILISIVATFMIEKLIHWKHHLSNHKGHHHPPITSITMLGDTAHNFIDGLALGASYLVSIPVGIATTIAVILHEIPQEIGNYGVLLHGGYTKKKALYVNFLSALSAIAGTIIALIVGMQITNAVVFLSAFAAGNFLYIAASDMIPELHKEVSPRKSFWQLVTMILGIVVMYSLVFLE